MPTSSDAAQNQLLSLPILSQLAIMDAQPRIPSLAPSTRLFLVEIQKLPTEPIFGKPSEKKGKQGPFS